MQLRGVNMRTVREAQISARTTLSLSAADLSDLFERRVSPQGLAFLAVLKMAFWKEARSGRSFSLSTPELARANFLPGWNRDRYWRALQDLLRTGDLVKVTDTQPRDKGRFASCRYRFGVAPNYVVQDDPGSIWHDANLQGGARQYLN